MNAPTMALQGDLYMSFELGDKHWKLTFGNGNHGPSRCAVAAGDVEAIFQHIAKASGASA